MDLRPPPVLPMRTSAAPSIAATDGADRDGRAPTGGGGTINLENVARDANAGDEGSDDGDGDGDSRAARLRRLRASYRLRRRRVTFGNPALGTYAGSVVTVHPRSARRARGVAEAVDGDGDDDDTNDDGCDDDEDYSDEDCSSDEEEDEESSSDGSSFSSWSCSSSSSSVGSMSDFFFPGGGDDDDDEERRRAEEPRRTAPVRGRIAVMTNVPPHQVPDGVLNLIRAHRPFVEHVRVVIGSSRSEEEAYREGRRERKRLRETMRNRGGDSGGKKGGSIVRRSRSQTWACENDDVANDGARPFPAIGALSLNDRGVGNDEDLALRPRSAGAITRSTSLDLSSHMPFDSELGDRGEDYGAMVRATPGFEKHSARDFGDDRRRRDDDGGEDKSYIILFVLDSEDSAATFVSDLHRRPYTSLDESETCSAYRAARVRGEGGVSLLGPFFASAPSSAAAARASPAPPDGGGGAAAASGAKDEHQCPVCLEMMSIPSTRAASPRAAAAASSADSSSSSSPSILTTVCNHSFHIDCLARWQDSPCPVCRYDHSGLNQTLSRCRVCATAVRNYVCLICGAVSCAGGPTSGRPPSVAGDAVAGAPQAPSQSGHALQHYEETLHAYALDTETQHVWDFAGGGYVHRLLQNAEDGKIVEGADPRLMEEERGMNLLGSGDAGGGREASSAMPLTALERSTIPTYSSSAEDDEAVHRKLEGFAGQYYTLLKSQLEQQRIFYEGRLEAIRREHESKARTERQSTADLISALKQERNQLEQRCATLRRKHKKVSDDTVFLKNLNESLEEDKLAFRKQIAVAQSELAEARQLTQQLLTPLEGKVSSLMLQLESGFGGTGPDDRKPPATAT